MPYSPSQQQQKVTDMFANDLMKRLDQDKTQPHIEEGENDPSEKHKRWQRMRNKGMTIVDVCEKTGASYREVRSNTTKELKSFYAYQWQDLREYGYTGKEISEIYGVSTSLVANGTYDSEKGSRTSSQRRFEWSRLRAAGVPAKQIAKDEGVHVSFVYKVAPLSADTVPASRLNLADLTKELAITMNGELCGYYTPLNRDSNAEEKDV